MAGYKARTLIRPGFALCKFLANVAALGQFGQFTPVISISNNILGSGAGAVPEYIVSNRGFSGSVKRTGGGSSSQDTQIMETRKGMMSSFFMRSHEVKQTVIA
jgi:hypothetical protein